MMSQFIIFRGRIRLLVFNFLCNIKQLTSEFLISILIMISIKFFNYENNKMRFIKNFNDIYHFFCRKKKIN
jgi:hypothetical protein